MTKEQADMRAAELALLVGTIVAVEDNLNAPGDSWQDDHVMLVFADGRRVRLMACGFHQSGLLSVSREP